MAVNCKCSKNLIFSACKWKLLYRSNTVKSAMILNRLLMFWLAPVQTGSLNHNDRDVHTRTPSYASIVTLGARFYYHL